MKHMTLRKTAAALTAAGLISGLFMMSSCSSGKDSAAGESTPSTTLSPEAKEDYRSYTGDHSYDAPLAALVYEQVEGEEKGIKGIQYREVTDIGGLLSMKDTAVCLYFCSSYNADLSGITAGVEDLAQTLWGKVIFVSVDTMKDDSLSSAYGINAVPDLVLIRNGVIEAQFDSVSRGTWSIDDVVKWITESGYEPDMSLLE